MLRKFHILLLFTAWTAFFAACDDGFDDYSTSPADVLTFSTDTVAFDTIISTIRTPFATFAIRNLSAKTLLISSIALEKGGNFKINVDGRAGKTFEKIEILAKDSIFVLVEAQASENQSDTPTEIIDRIVFVTNGVTQSVVLQAVAQDAEVHKTLTVTTDSTLSSAKPYLIYDSLVVQAGATLRIPAGTCLYMHANAEIRVQGTLHLLGTEDNPVVIRGDRFDRTVGIPYDRIPGQWGGIYFASGSYDNVMEHARIRNGTYGLIFSEPEPTTTRSKMRMNNTVLTNFKGMLLSATNCRIAFDHCELSNAKDGLLQLNGGEYTLDHCTLANYYFSGRQEYGWGTTDNATVFLHDNTQATFDHTIIWGTHYLSTSKINVAPEAECDLRECLTDEDPKFRIIMSEDYIKADFIYDFRLQTDSPAWLPDGGYIGCYGV
ncbi:hypothetical protein AGMMS49965_24560 [Bacteroidia bacterium]|nr:hypothetical protein AGMMS49965_24560 [Bacteroidia bacterium]